MYSKQLETARSAVASASEICRSVFAELVTDDTLIKKDRSPVTVADFAAQCIVKAAVLAAFPDDGFIAEEEGDALRNEPALLNRVQSAVYAAAPQLDGADLPALLDRNACSGGQQRFWTLDPIDGTKGFLRGDQYACALALLEDGAPVVAALGCPNLSAEGKGNFRGNGCIYSAKKGAGAKVLSDGTLKDIKVSEINSPRDTAFCESVEAAHSAHGDSTRIAELLNVQADPVRIDSQCKYAVVADGRADAYLRLPTRPGYQEKIWDHAAGWLVTIEAGGQVSDIYGKPLEFDHGSCLTENKGIVATNGKLHNRICAAVATALNLDCSE